MFKLMQLPYAYDALEPFIDEQTVQIHYGKHHQGYVNKLNAALEGHSELLSLDLADLLLSSEVPEDLKTAVFNNGGQVYNHNLYWESMAPNAGGEPTGELLEAINRNFGSFDKFKEEFSQAGSTQFGSGWAWLSVDSEGVLSISKTSNADNPLYHGKTPIMTMDVWEHAYYLKYKNARPDYIQAFWQVVNWEEVGKKFSLLSK
jgi:Fe-Mn family superoxide dismutase